MTTVDEPPCDVPVPDGLAWLKPAPVCRHPRGHDGMCDDGTSVFWSANGSYGIPPSRYFESLGGAS